jgi:hypothetical protein
VLLLFLLFNCCCMQGGVLAFPAAAVRTMKVMALLPQQPLVRAVKRGMDKWQGARYQKQNTYATNKLPA